MTAEAEDEQYQNQLEDELKWINKKLEEQKVLVNAAGSQCSSVAYNALTTEQKENCAFF